MDLNRITLGALIIALGLLVDDAIIAVEMMVVKMEQGWPRTRAAAFAWTSTAFPMLTGTLVTAIGFVPIGFAVSAVGEYAGGIFWVVAIALLASWVVAVLFTPLFGVMLLPDRKNPGRAHADPEAIYDTRPYNLLRRLVRFCVRRRGTVTLATLGLFASASSPSAMCSSNSFRSPIVPSSSLKSACRPAPRSRRPTRPRARARSSSPAIPTCAATRPTSARARRASGSASTRSFPTAPMRKS